MKSIRYIGASLYVSAALFFSSCAGPQVQPPVQEDYRRAELEVVAPDWVGMIEDRRRTPGINTSEACEEVLTRGTGDNNFELMERMYHRRQLGRLHSDLVLDDVTQRFGELRRMCRDQEDYLDGVQQGIIRMVVSW